MGTVMSVVISTIVTSFFFYLTLKLFREDVGIAKIFGVVLLKEIIVGVAWYLMGTYMPGLGLFAHVISFVVGLAVYKYGFALSWLRTIMLVIVSVVILGIVTFILVLIGFGTLIGFSLML
jgi:hypothetical protein